jgi:glycosyltransferase involved in cell wall biosynthesis
LHEAAVTADVIEPLHTASIIRPMRMAPFSGFAADGASAAAAPGARRIAVVTETYPPEINGVAMSIARVVHGLQVRGHAVQLVRPRQRADGDAAGRGAATGARLVLTGGLPIPNYPHLRMGLPCRRALERLWREARPDVVHIATEGPLGWSALRAAARLGVPVSSDFRTNFHAYGRHYRLGWLARPIMACLRAFHNRCAVTMVPTEALRTQLEAAGFERLAVVSRGVDTALFDPARRSAALRAAWGAAEGDLVIACVGRLAAEKNLGALLAAWEAVRARDPRARLVLVGDGPQADALRRACPTAHFAGQRRGEDLAAHYASADLFAFPSLTETFGNVTPEAMASGLPVVAFDSAAAGQLIRSGENGVLVPPPGTSDFVAAVLALAADAPRRAALGHAARETVQAIGWDAVVAGFEAVLASVLVAAPRAGGRADPGLLPGAATAALAAAPAPPAAARVAPDPRAW